MKLKRIVERNDTDAGRRFDLLVQCCIFVSLVSFSIETLSGLRPLTRSILAAVEFVTVMIFTAEYALRLFVANNKWRFVFSFYGLIDLVAIAPYYIGFAVDLRSIRVIRLLRVLRTLKVLRYSRAIQRFRHAFSRIKDELLIFFVVTSMMVFLASVGIYYFERDAQPDSFGSIFHAMWWAIATLSTVGYGDVYAVTIGGRIFTGIVLLIGLGIVAVPAGLLAAALTESAKTIDTTASDTGNGD